MVILVRFLKPGKMAAGKMGEKVSTALSLPSPGAFFAFTFAERLFTNILEPGTGWDKICRVKNLFVSDFYPWFALRRVSPSRGKNPGYEC